MLPHYIYNPSQMLYQQHYWPGLFSSVPRVPEVANLISSTLSADCNKERSGNIVVTLDDQQLWHKFHQIGTEMIVTRSGRRMFPILKVRVEGLEEHKQYYITLDIVPVDEHRYKFTSSQWVHSGRAESHYYQRCQFVHPDSPMSGAKWLKEGAISFHRVKLTNNTKEISENMLLNSMHRYQPIIRILEEGNNAVPGKEHFFYFKETRFYAVTAYQNEKITKLKIDNNPFAKGFRDREKSHNMQKRSLPFMDQLRQSDKKLKEDRNDHEEETSPQPPASCHQMSSLLSQNHHQMFRNARRELERFHPETLVMRMRAAVAESSLLGNAGYLPLQLNGVPLINLALPFQNKTVQGN